MEFLQTARKRNYFGDMLHILFNIALAASVFGLMYLGQNILLALILVFVSKWRVFAVRPRYWRVNILSNLVDFTVGFSIVVLMYSAGVNQDEFSVYYQAVLSILYAVWLIVIKPRSSKVMVNVQAGTALFLGLWSLSVLVDVFPQLVFVALCGLIAYGVARHILVNNYNESDVALMSLAYSLLIAQVAWVIYHWNVAYVVPFIEYLPVAQFAIVASLISFALLRVYDNLSKDEPGSILEVMPAVTFSIVASLVLVYLFGSSGPGIV